jgi:hypothetical protein
VSLLLGAWLGGAACYVGVLLTPSRSRPPMALLGVVCMSLIWPVSIVLAHEAASSSGGRL